LFFQMTISHGATKTQKCIRNKITFVLGTVEGVNKVKFSMPHTTYDRMLVKYYTNYNTECRVNSQDIQVIRSFLFCHGEYRESKQFIIHQ